MAAWRTSTRAPWRARSAVASSNRLICSAVSPWSTSSAQARCVISPRIADLGVVAKLGGKGGELVHRHAEARHARVDLEVHVDRPARDTGAHQPRERRDLPRVVHDRNEAARDDLLVSFAVVAAHHEDRRDDAGLAQLDALFEEGHAEAVDPTVTLERAGDGRRPVPVAIGLEHRPDASRPRVAPHDTQVVPQGLQVDLRAGGPDGVRRSRAAWAKDPRHEWLAHRGENARRDGRDSTPQLPPRAPGGQERGPVRGPAPRRELRRGGALRRRPARARTASDTGGHTRRRAR